MKLFEFFYRCCLALLYPLVFSVFFSLHGAYTLFLSLTQKKIKPKLSQGQLKIDGVSIIIPTWNKLELLKKCLELLDVELSKTNKTTPTEIIVIENGSTDGSKAFLANHRFSTQLVVLDEPTNLGFAKAINKGLNQAKYNYVYLLNNDMEVRTGFLSALLKTANALLNEGGGFFGLASQIFFYDPTKKREESGKTYSLPFLGFLDVRHVVEPANLKVTTPTLYPGGGSALFNKQLFQMLGGYDHAAYTPLYCEDLDAGFAAWRLGFASWFVPESQVTHHHQSSSKQLKLSPEYYLHKNWLVLLLKHLEQIDQIALHLLIYPFWILFKPGHANYALDAVQHFFAISNSRARFERLKTKYTTKKVLNFITFETSHVR